jgi:hypothetical protein
LSEIDLKELNMGGYLEFDSTGVKEVDSILSAIENAGDGYHHTSQWGESENGDKSYIDFIQDAANKCADKIKKLTSDNSDYAKCLECADDIISDYDININPELIAKTIERHFA